MMPPLRSFDDLDGKERGQKKTDDLRAMTTLGPRTLVATLSSFVGNREIKPSNKTKEEIVEGCSLRLITPPTRM